MFEVVWACDAKRGTLRGKEGNGNESTGEKEERNSELREDGWTTKRVTSKRRDCRLMMCTTVLHRGVYIGPT